MKIDKSKKYEGLGLTFECYDELRWRSVEQPYPGVFTAYILEPQMQAWLDAGHIKPVKNTKIVQVNVGHVTVGFDGYPHFAIRQSCPDLAGLTSTRVYAEFEVEA